jgi:hypothetical protein
VREDVGINGYPSKRWATEHCGFVLDTDAHYRLFK